MVNRGSVRKIKKKYEKDLLDHKGVVGTGVGRVEGTGDEEKMGIIVDVSRKLKEHENIPKKLEGVPVVVREVGKIRALGD